MDRAIRKPARERQIEAPLLSLKIEEEVKRLKSEPEWISGKIDGITLVKYPYLRVVLVALRKGTSLREHTVKGPISLFVISGKISLKSDNEKREVGTKGLLSLRKTISHNVRALADSVFLLTYAPASS